jgi:hypothetical protein
MNRFRTILGYLGGLLLIGSSVVHTVFGWRGLSTSLAKTNAPADLVMGLSMGWHFAGVAMFVFGCIVIWELNDMGRGGSLALWPVMLIGVIYVGFGVWARAISGSNFFLMTFAIPGILLVIAAWPTPLRSNAAGE